MAKTEKNTVGTLEISFNEGNVMTEYEKKFSDMGNPICKLIADR